MSETMNTANPPPRWLCVRLTVAETAVAAAEAALTEAGALAISLLDAADVPIHEPAPGSAPLWPETVVEGLFEGTAEPALISIHLEAAGLLGRAVNLNFRALAEQDWERAWMDRYAPMRFGRSLWICPWHIEPDPDWPLVIRLDPGLAFGSGTHPTTALCLEWLDGSELAGLSVLDFGCGSGVLAIAAGLKGAARLVAVDHDPQALKATASNAARNGLGGRIESLLPEAFHALDENARQFDLIVANILAAPLIEQARLLTECLRSGGELVLSGILAEQSDAVIAAYRGLAEPIDQTQREDWMRIVLTRL